VRHPYDTLRYIIKDKLNLAYNENIYYNINNVNHISYTTSMLQIRNNIYNNSIGSWKKYNNELYNFKNIYINKLKKLNFSDSFIFREISIPCIDKLNNTNDNYCNSSYYKVNLNWKASIEYDYNNMIKLVT
jgi:hypothetical protein